MIDVRALDAAEVQLVGDALGLSRLHQGNGFYLVAWEGDEPAGHLHLALIDPPELQDVQVAASHRRRGVATKLIQVAESEARARGYNRMRVSVGDGNEPAQSLYRSCEYVDVGLKPKHVKGPIRTRAGTIEVDEILITWQKALK